MRRWSGLLVTLLMIGCGSSRAEPDPLGSVPSASAETAPGAAAEPGGRRAALSIPEPWPTRSPMVAELVAGEIIGVEESWWIGMLGEGGSSGLTVRSRPTNREAAYVAGCERLEDHDPRYSVARTAVSASVDGVSIRMAIPGLFPRQLDVQASVAATPAEVAAQCPRLAPLSDELASLEGWPAPIRGCSRTRSESEPERGSVRIGLDEAHALAWLQTHRFVERRSESAEIEGRVFERSGDAPATARWHASRNELEILVGGDD